jgi:hypothetical protein
MSSSFRYGSRQGAKPAKSHLFVSASFGLVAAVSAAGYMAAGLTAELIKQAKSDEGRSQEQVRRYIGLQKLLAKTKDPEDVSRIKSKMLRARELGEIYKIKSLVATSTGTTSGTRLEGSAIEIRRNVLADQWENAPPEDKAQIEALISVYDKQLVALELEMRAALAKDQPKALLGTPRRAPGLWKKKGGPWGSPAFRRGSRADADDSEEDADEPASAPDAVPAATPGPGAPAPAAAPAGPPVAKLRDPELILPMYDEGVRQLVRGKDDTEISFLDGETKNAKSGYGPRGATTEEQDALYAEQTFKAAVLNPEQPISVNQALVNGFGGLQFASDGPPGPGRNVRIAMYPGRASDSYAGADGIVVPGDDPVLLMRLTATVNTNFVASTDYIVRTQTFTYGAYRAMGFQSNPQGNYLVTTATGENRNTAVVLGVGISVRSLQIYNGEEMLLPVGEIDASSISILDPPDAYFGISGLNLPAYLQAGPYNPRAADRYYMGLRTNPVLDSTGRVDAVIRCFVSVRSSNPAIAPTGMLATDRIEVPISFNLIGQMLEDKIFGNPKVPGPAARPGAQVQLGLRDLGRDTEGVQQLQLRNTRYVPLTPEPKS